ncbi:MAG: hydrogenase maturation nickel metallochaperone HypA [Oscillospiraceae bacterium]
MHELGIMKDVLETALRVASENKGKRVTKVTLKVGVLSGVLPNYMASFFELIAKGTAAEGAQVIIENEAAVFLCRDCGKKTTFQQFGPDFICEHCDSTNLQLLQGKTFQIVSVGII